MNSLSFRECCYVSEALVISGDFNLSLDDLRGNDTKKFVDLVETFCLSQHVSARPIYQVIP